MVVAIPWFIIGVFVGILIGGVLMSLLLESEDPPE